jgi:hypothetical protein
MAKNNLKYLNIKLENLKDKIINKKLLERLVYDVGYCKEDFERILRNLRQNNKIKYIFKNYYYVMSIHEIKTKVLKYNEKEIVFSILNKLKINWYLGFNNALLENRIIHQQQQNITIVNDKISQKIKISGINFIFVKTKKDFIFGFKKLKTKNRLTMYFSDVEKTYIDFIYFKKKNLIELEKICDKTKLKRYLKKYPTRFLK